MSLLTEIFTWWNGQTIGTRLFTWRKGRLVGEDDQGNRYFVSKDGSDRRWVIYNGLAEASRVPAGWHGWLHHVVDVPPSEETYTPRAWEKPHKANLTGTPGAYKPDGSLANSGGRPRVTGDYDAWQPE
ncbi:NADH:ubiquinone oxidoreductase 17.2 kD subunit [Tepidicaulis marinus]|jgi:NADH:ubiquinone oxidoreductase subunit|uniref:NADH:ubiquinone oxidoreductase 17.2 kD subunit n=1 Tax=Tepidicaulis marinus TaxID=1333998 RepID=A0A081B9C4_9HYPH|nr:NADH:ubiquinone oxidoreductase subunit NDUFA12 [Tepidicaulis marinus]GAK44642.1 NADH:ubiquinone oxidoreductase 17.2 kD subunit [Tepidicaulis marinus]